MSEQTDVLLNEIRYAERLCLRTARLYRRLQTGGVFLTIVSGSATLSALSSTMPKSVSVIGAICFALFGALMISIRPAEKALANEADAKRYAQLRTTASAMDADTLRAALAKAREMDTAEIEPLREVAFNDVVLEVGRNDQVLPLSMQQRLLAALA